MGALPKRLPEEFWELTKVVETATRNVPASHGYPHLKKVAEIAVYLALRLETDLFLPAVSGLVHDLRWWDEEERITRKIKVGVEDHATMSVEEVLSQAGIDHRLYPPILQIVANHGPRAATFLEKLVSDADRASRMGYEGLLSILCANRRYGLPLYIEGGPILWDPSQGFVRNEEIKSGVDDVRACQSWWLVQQTPPGNTLFRAACWVNYRFLQLFDRERGSYDDWILLLEEIVRTQQETRERLFESIMAINNPISYEEYLMGLESPDLLVNKT